MKDINIYKNNHDAHENIKISKDWYCSKKNNIHTKVNVIDK